MGLSYRLVATALSAAALTCYGLGEPAANAAPDAATTARAPAQAPAGAREPVGGPLLAGTGMVAKPGPGVALPPVVPVDAWVVADANTGEVLAAKAPHVRLSPASTLKILTAYALLPRISPNNHYVGTRADENAQGTRVGIVSGQRYTMTNLWQGLLLASGNDAANALATIAGGVPATLRLMEDEARRLRAADTLATTPSGLDNDNGPGPYSSAYDLALITRAALQLPEFRAYVSTRTARFPGKGRGRSYQIDNQNHLLWQYEGAIGVKTGFTSKAKNTFVAAATRNGHTLIVTAMHGKHGIHKDTAKLLDWGFAAEGRVEPVGRLVGPLAPPAAPSSAGAEGQGSHADAGPAAAFGARGRHDGSRRSTSILLAAGFLGLLLVAGVGLRVRRRRREADTDPELARL
jgi:D-alanyl-D-alanine carboxypeptidase (penicillin-binding protein 5/6)